ncbi:LysR family transcriptional regulator [Verminephrobacter eiseniae]|uniref:LysR family transcriptional regulator n=1 Tax=Verminephrobacter eiseniae TaxID=364317 RepID=UPI002238370A|nr:LysR family transcriptional regulator [Verminephrobacter eiseniae]MCW5231897.1 LysR family transcriptional regulator [Verminephrobacter eiseniae]MCW5293630.1 LysR family transcriptional regulator [Verminephrobacter eiseniae]MCW8184287.1 LysR family transcriptional regulator [Verminephrobacter eiseniae]MCW8224028.1 LysR family transcriptional regulator [Verminephrobacter eiseniae]MCW8233302.1 LysR family transcriptional regulator [Verminephrobacter eiseniae]
MRLRDVDLNLLVAFDVLMRECHVTRAASLLDISQSSMSLALAKLRVLFHDPLLIKSGNALIPTIRARELIAQVEQVLRSVDLLIHEQVPFDPSQANQVITMIVVDYIDFVVMPALMRALEREASDVSLRIINPNPRRLGEIMSRGDIDLALSYFPTPPENIRTRPLFTDRLVGIARTGHPMFERPLSLERFCEYGHVAIEPGEGATMYNALVDDALHNVGRQRRVMLSKPTFLGVPFVIAQTDLIATLPERLVQRFTGIAPVRIFEPPLHLNRLNVVLMWHDRTHNNPLHRWIRELVVKLFTR